MTLRTLLVSTVVCAALIACRRGPSKADLQEIARLQATRDTLRLQIDSLSGPSRFPRESLLGALQAMRAQLLRLTDDLLRQRAEALRAGAEFEYQESAFRPDLARADSLAKAIRSARDSLRVTEQRVASMGSGLLGALAQMQLQTQRLTVDMLEMSRLAALYGVGLPPLKPDSALKKP
jgi:hypothetical protein